MAIVTIDLIDLDTQRQTPTGEDGEEHTPGSIQMRKRPAEEIAKRYEDTDIGQHVKPKSA